MHFRHKCKPVGDSVESNARDAIVNILLAGSKVRDGPGFLKLLDPGGSLGYEL